MPVFYSLLAGIALVIGSVSPAIPATNDRAQTTRVALTASSQSAADGDDTYLDDRSSPAQLLQSYVNAVNRKEYLRAYSYWEPEAAAVQLPTFPEFAHGYAGIAHVDLTLGDVQGDAGAGQLYYSVPIALTVLTISGTMQLFAGCYTLHLAQPTIQASPPFRPLGIRSANIRQMADEDEVDEALNDSCQP